MATDCPSAVDIGADHRIYQYAIAGGFEYLVAAFRKGLTSAGFTEGQNVAVEYRWAYGQYDRLPAQAAELVHEPVTILVALGGEPATLAAKSATSKLPILFGVADDPVKPVWWRASIVPAVTRLA